MMVLCFWFWFCFCLVFAISNCASTSSIPSPGELVSRCSFPAGQSIPDSNPSGITDRLSFSHPFDIVDLDVSIDIIHTWTGDISAILFHVDTGTNVSLIRRPGDPQVPFGCSSPNYNVTLDDEAGNPIENACPPWGTFVPEKSLSLFDGQEYGGYWDLVVSDHAPGDVGTLDRWCLIAVLGAPSTYFTTRTTTTTSTTTSTITTTTTTFTTSLTTTRSSSTTTVPVDMPTMSSTIPVPTTIFSSTSSESMTTTTAITTSTTSSLLSKTHAFETTASSSVQDPSKNDNGNYYVMVFVVACCLAVIAIILTSAILVIRQTLKNTEINTALPSVASQSKDSRRPKPAKATKSDAQHHFKNQANIGSLKNGAKESHRDIEVSKSLTPPSPNPKLEEQAHLDVGDSCDNSPILNQIVIHSPTSSTSESSDEATNQCSHVNYQHFDEVIEKGSTKVNYQHMDEALAIKVKPAYQHFDEVLEKLEQPSDRIDQHLDCDEVTESKPNPNYQHFDEAINATK